MDRQPVLEGDRLLLRPLSPDDWVPLYGVASDPLIWKVHPAHDRWREEVFRAFFADALAKGGAIVAIDKESGRIVGSSRWQNHDAARLSVEIGWTFLARSHWGGSYNRELKRLMIAHALRWVETVVFVVGENNLRSRRAMEKIGGKAAGIPFGRRLSRLQIRPSGVPTRSSPRIKSGATRFAMAFASRPIPVMRACNRHDRRSERLSCKSTMR